MIAAPKAASQLFCKREEVIFGRARNKMNGFYLVEESFR
jgi:hypothetical protein